MDKPLYRVLLGLPSGDSFHWERNALAVQYAAAIRSTEAEAQPFRITMRLVRGSISLLPLNFNHLWCCAKNYGRWEDGVEAPADFFAMLHADVSAEFGWLRKLIAICLEKDADAVSAICAIKSEHGLTSCGIDPFGPMLPHKRMTMAELANMPETWCAADIGHPNIPTLINTGCWVWDLRRPLAQQFTGFHFFDEVRKHINAKGQEEWRAHNEPEDWRFSQWAFEHGGR